MKSLGVWFSSIALGAAMMCSAPSAKAQVPEGFTYQGVLVDNGVPVNGTVTLQISLADKSGTVLYSEMLANVVVSDGLFNVVIGGSSPFPTSMNFNEQYFLTMVVTTSGGSFTIGPMPLWDAPYAINSFAVNGISASLVPVAGDLFPVPIGTGYTGTAKLDPGFLPTIPNSSLATPVISQINEIAPNTTGNFNISAGSGITITPEFNGITVSGSDVVGNTSLSQVGFTVQDSETNGNEALLVTGGIGANNASGLPDGTGLSSGSPQTYWADQVSVPTTAGTSLKIFNTLVSATSTIVITPVEPAIAGNQFMITAQSAGTFTVSSTASMGGGAVTAINYLVINH